MYLQSFQSCSVNKVVETDHNKMLFTLEVQTKIPVATETWQRREDRDASGEVFPPFGSRPALAPGCSANSSSPLSDPCSSTSSSTASWMPVCLAGAGLTSPRHRAKGAMELPPAGPALHGRVPLSKQTVQWATSHGQEGTCHYQPCMAG